MCPTPACRRVILLPLVLLMLPILLPFWIMHAIWNVVVFFVKLPFLPVLIPYRYVSCIDMLGTPCTVGYMRV